MAANDRREEAVANPRCGFASGVLRFAQNSTHGIKPFQKRRTTGAKTLGASEGTVYRWKAEAAEKGGGV
jgi:hypothetical protein